MHTVHKLGTHTVQSLGLTPHSQNTNRQSLPLVHWIFPLQTCLRYWGIRVEEQEQNGGVGRREEERKQKEKNIGKNMICFLDTFPHAIITMWHS